MNPKLKKLTGICGILGPALFVIVFTLEGRLRAGYDPRSMFISALSLGPRGWIQIANFILLGLLLFAFTRGLAAEFKGVKTARGGIVLLTIVACLYFISGPFVMDPTGTPTAQSSVHGLIHGIAGGIVFLLMAIIPFTFLRTFKTIEKWRSFRPWTLSFGIVLAVACLFFTITSKSPTLQMSTASWSGWIQRAALIPFMVWVFLFALKFSRLEK
jgi:uncharacterized membrane protein